MDWEFRVLDSIQKYFSGNFMDNIMPKISSLGNAGLIWIIFTIVMLLFKNTRKYGYTCGLSLIIMLFTGNIFIKNIVCRLRPFQIRDYINLIINPPLDSSYPSGHTYASFAFATALLCCNKKLGIPAIILACMISFSRLYLYVHFPSDVFCGILIGILTSLIALKFCFSKSGMKLINNLKILGNDFNDLRKM